MAHISENPRYLDLLKPHPNGAWLTMLWLYRDGAAFNALLDDLAAPFASARIDVVAGPEAMGFALGAGVAARLRTGFVPIRKGGKLLGPNDTAQYPHHKGGTQTLELQTNSIEPGTRVLLVDQWIETGGSMYASINLVERQQGIVAGISTICIEDGKGGDPIRERYECATLVQPGTLLQRQCTAHSFDMTA